MQETLPHREEVLFLLFGCQDKLPLRRTQSLLQGAWSKPFGDQTLELGINQLDGFGLCTVRRAEVDSEEPRISVGRIVALDVVDQPSLLA